jgi:hypothetical protein
MKEKEGEKERETIKFRRNFTLCCLRRVQGMRCSSIPYCITKLNYARAAKFFAYYMLEYIIAFLTYLYHTYSRLRGCEILAIGNLRRNLVTKIYSV